jgi:hypothetical protein
MWPFKKRKQETNIPELKEYYQNVQRERTGLAWLLAIASLLITFSVIILLFMGGRWAFNRLNSSDNNPKTDRPTEQVSEDNNTEAKPKPTGDQEISPSDVAQNETESAQDTSQPQSTNDQSLPSSGTAEIPRTGPTEE